MNARFGGFIAWQLAGMALGWLLGARDARLLGLFGGMLAGAICWFGLDLARAGRLLGWMRRGAPRDAPPLRGFWGELSDRTARLLRERERKLRASDERLRKFLEAIQASPNGVLLLDAENRIEWCSETAADHLGIDAGRDLLAHIVNLVRAPAFVAYLAGHDFRGNVVIDSRSLAAPRGCRIELQVHPYREGRKLLLTRDVTQIEQAEAMRRDFVANVSHEIRTPLTVIGGFVEALQTLPLDEAEQRRHLQLVAQQTQRMQALVGDLLALSRLEGSPPPGRRDWTPVRELFERIEQEARPLSERLGAPAARVHDFVFTEAIPGCEIAGVRSELHSALANLVNNAVRYSPPGQRIDVRFMLRPDGRAEFSVQDSGPGIAPEHLSRLSERFYRIDQGRSRETGGTGLGLAIVKHIAQRHGGELQIRSQVGRGSCFGFWLPATRVRRPDPAGEAGHGAADDPERVAVAVGAARPARRVRGAAPR